MKLNKLFIGIMAASMCFNTACTDLEPEIYTDVLKEDYFKTPEQFSTLIANAYSQLAGEYGYVYREGYWSMQEYTSDEVVVPTRGTDWFDNGVPQAMHKHTWEENTRECWLYDLIDFKLKGDVGLTYRSIRVLEDHWGFDSNNDDIDDYINRHMAKFFVCVNK